jgi:hypothetical protein
VSSTCNPFSQILPLHVLFLQTSMLRAPRSPALYGEGIFLIAAPLPVATICSSAYVSIRNCLAVILFGLPVILDLRTSVPIWAPRDPNRDHGTISRQILCSKPLVPRVKLSRCHLCPHTSCARICRISFDSKIPFLSRKTQYLLCSSSS